MSDRDHYPPGVPCWVDVLAPDVEASKRFYAGLFGWELVGPGPMPGDPPGEYSVARLRSRDVAGVGSLPEGAGPPAWNTYMAVDDVSEAVERARAAGADVLQGPLDAAPAGRLAVLADPTGATFCLWQAELRQGAQLINEPSAWSMSLLRTTDPQRAGRFYAELFGWQSYAFAMGDGEVTLFRLPGYVGGEPQQPVPRDVVAGMIPSGDADSAAGGSNWGVDFWIDDAGAAASAAPGLGGRVIAPPFETPGFTTAVLADPHGAVFSVNQLKMPSEAAE